MPISQPAISRCDKKITTTTIQTKPLKTISRCDKKITTTTIQTKPLNYGVGRWYFSVDLCQSVP